MPQRLQLHYLLQEAENNRILNISSIYLIFEIFYIFNNFMIDDYISLKRALSYPRVNELTFNSYISEDIETVKKYTFNSKSQFNAVVGPMKSGKTFGISKIAIEENIPTVLAFPLRSLAFQKYTELLKMYGEDKIKYIQGAKSKKSNDGTSTTEIAQFIKQKIKFFIVVYDSLPKLFKAANFKPAHYNLIIDEAHNLVTQYDFRSNAINNIIELEEKFKKVIYLTATPEGIFDENLRNPEITLFKSANSNGKQISIETKIYKPSDELYIIINNIKMANGICVLLLDNKKKLKTLKKHLIELGYKKSEILLFTSIDKLDDVFVETIKTGEFPKSTKVVLCTRVFSDGVNIFNQIDRLIIFNLNDYWIKRQFIGRFRNGINSIFDFHPGFKQKFQNVSNKELFIKQEVESAKQIIFENKMRNNSIQLNFSHSKAYLRKNRINNLSIHNDKISWTGIAFAYLSKCNEDIHNSKKIYTQYFEEICNYSISISEENYENYSISKKDIDSLSGKNLDLHYNFLDIKDTFENYFLGLFISYSLIERKASHLIFMNNSNRIELVKFLSNNNYNPNEIDFYLNDRKLLEILRLTADLFVDGFDKNTLIALIKSNSNSISNLSKIKRLILIHSYLILFDNLLLEQLEHILKIVKQFTVFDDEMITTLLSLIAKLEGKNKISAELIEITKNKYLTTNNDYNNQISLNFLNKFVFTGTRKTNFITVSKNKTLSDVFKTFQITSFNTNNEYLKKFISERIKRIVLSSNIGANDKAILTSSLKEFLSK